MSLLRRTTRGSWLTTEGSLVVDWSRDVLDSADRLSTAVSSLQQRGAVQVRMAASLTVAEYLVPLWLARYREQAPAVDVRLSVANSEQVLGRVADGEADLGFIETTHLPTGLPRRRVGTDRLVVVVAEGHRWAGLKDPLPAADLAATPLIVREPGSGTRIALVDALRAQGLEMAEPALSLESNAAVRVGAMAGVAPAVMSEHAVGEALAGGKLRAVPVAGLKMTRPLHAVWGAGRWPAGAAGDLLTTVREVVSSG